MIEPLPNFSASFYADLERINDRPEPFEIYTAKDLWTDEHTSQQMLAFHLNGELDVSSRRIEFIEVSVGWLADRFKLSSGSRVIDFGCGPGLYASRLANLGAAVTGVDFSPRSISYARKQAEQDGLEIDYHEANYLDFEPDGKFDLATLIMCDFCALSPEQRSAMLRMIDRHLSPEGRVVLDVHSLSAFEQKEESASYRKNLLDGFWSPYQYFGFLNTFKYDPEKVILDKYTIIEPARTRQIYNWLQYFSVEMLERELESTGFEIEEVLGDVAGRPFTPQQSEFAVVLKSHYCG
ncbi:MAG: class I SAM-dependent methyltransferase [Leptolyngbya sp. SIOISBB]|nr:class I SAM-dependent methyltransferase [Leptolyngbya sp. SIOISBB]